MPSTTIHCHQNEIETQKQPCDSITFNNNSHWSVLTYYKGLVRFHLICSLDYNATYLVVLKIICSKFDTATNWLQYMIGQSEKTRGYLDSSKWR